MAFPCEVGTKLISDKLQFTIGYLTCPYRVGLQQLKVGQCLCGVYEQDVFFGIVTPISSRKSLCIVSVGTT